MTADLTSEDSTAPRRRRHLARLIARALRRDAGGCTARDTPRGPDAAAQPRFESPRFESPRFESMEPRMLLSAELGLGLDAPRDPLADELPTTPWDALRPAPAITPRDPGPITLPDPFVLDEQLATDDDTSTHRRELLIIDAAVEDRDTLAAQFREGLAAGTRLDVFMLDPGGDGIAAISRILAGHGGLDAVHLVSHGSDGAITLGATTLDASGLEQRQADLAAWGRALSADGDLLLYGCEVAATSAGEAWLQGLAAATGADVAASADLTGGASLGGDWDLEFRHGEVETVSLAAPPGGGGWQHSLALIARESFDYAAGAGGLDGQTGGSGWSGGWENVGNEMTVVSTTLADDTGTLAVSGGAAQLSATSGIVTQGRDLAAPLGADGTTVWASFLVKPDATASPNFAGIGFGDAGVVIGYAQNEYMISNRDGTGTVRGQRHDVPRSHPRGALSGHRGGRGEAGPRSRHGLQHRSLR
jgi:hypothetical protein